MEGRRKKGGVDMGDLQDYEYNGLDLRGGEDGQEGCRCSRCGGDMAGWGYLRVLEYWL